MSWSRVLRAVGRHLAYVGVGVVSVVVLACLLLALAVLVVGLLA